MATKPTDDQRTLLALREQLDDMITRLHARQVADAEQVADTQALLDECTPRVPRWSASSASRNPANSTPRQAQPGGAFVMSGAVRRRETPAYRSRSGERRSVASDTRSGGYRLARMTASVYCSVVRSSSVMPRSCRTVRM